ncbi:MAG: Rhodopirellula transposase DDE domain protein [Candidatus Argoarchaeum ethanivorans]|uniref:Rhodopirellula transposase DDE domain protein n=1 Tax=Candidatus Argoarchaeum ethanivorans TaxID=2608793 RepID=A0A812A0D0_9EURY|nr:MAG: Rhodopirellula transposase DDE domain protein [Candidatus Argoarchaeum ethanivorans]
MGENTAGDPMSFLKWTCKSTYKIADELNLRGHKISAETVRQLLRERDYSLQANVKTKEGGSEPERDAQFRYIYDFPSLGIGVAIPYGAYDINRGEGFVNVGISRYTSLICS